MVKNKFLDFSGPAHESESSILSWFLKPALPSSLVTFGQPDPLNVDKDGKLF